MILFLAISIIAFVLWYSYRRAHEFTPTAAKWAILYSIWSLSVMEVVWRLMGGQ